MTQFIALVDQKKLHRSGTESYEQLVDMRVPMEVFLRLSGHFKKEPKLQADVTLEAQSKFNQGIWCRILVSSAMAVE